MPQFARPSADSLDGNWTKSSGGNTDMYQMIDEAVVDDADFIQSELTPSSSPCVVALSPVTDPVSSSGHIVRYRYQKDAAGGAQINLVVQLREGYVNEGTPGTLIASATHNNISDTITAGTFTLSGGEADAITDYADLYLRFVATQV